MTIGRITPAGQAIGMILPSSNRIVERVTLDVLSCLPGNDACFARIPYFGNGQGQPVDGYDDEPLLAAAETLAQARVDVICWNATRGALFGFAPDRALSARIGGQTGLPVVTTSLAALEVFQNFGIGRIGLVTQGTEEQGAVFKSRFAEQGIETRTDLHLGYRDNFAAAHADPRRIVEFARSSALSGGIDAVVVWSTNLAGHAFAAKLEAELGIPVLDSAAIGVWTALRALNVDTRAASSRGRLFGQDL
jgi:maleate isomerase